MRRPSHRSERYLTISAWRKSSREFRGYQQLPPPPPPSTPRRSLRHLLPPPPVGRNACQDNINTNNVLNNNSHNSTARRRTTTTTTMVAVAMAVGAARPTPLRQGSVALLLQPLDWRYSNVVGSHGGGGGSPSSNPICVRRLC
jgi:hypothetical protein